MKLLSDELLRSLVGALRPTIGTEYTGKVILTLHFHMGTLGSVDVGFELYQKPDAKIRLAGEGPA